MSDTTIKEQLTRLADGLEAHLSEQQRERRQREYDSYEEYFAAHKGRRALRRTPLAEYLEAIPGAPALFQKPVPPEFWLESSGTAEVSCPCGDTPQIARDSLAECACGLIFIFTGTQVRVWREQKEDAGVS